jgi:hypothetical protein
MTTENEVVTETVAEPVIDMAAAEQAKREAEMQAELQAQDKAAQDKQAQVLAEMDQLRVDEASLAAEQDAALAAVKAECDAYRDALTTEEQQ